MRVYNYLELMKHTSNMNMSEHEVFFDEEFPAIAIPVEDFYSQPFKPELITELFQGWEKETYSYNDVLFTRYYHKKQNGIEYRLEFHSNYYDIENFETIVFRLIKNRKFVDIPPVLDNFITDCQRVGIELEWK